MTTDAAPAPAYVDPVAEPGLFDIEAPPAVSLADKFGLPPFSVLDRRTGDWQDRKRRWATLGIESEVGRAANLTYGSEGATDEVSLKIAALGTTSIFDPVACELVYRWFTADNDHVLDPFAGGSVRGITASILGRHYTGIDIRPEQVEANRAQGHIGHAAHTPAWIDGDSSDVHNLVGDDMFDLVFSCPPYADLEVYSDDPNDISTMPYDDFERMHATIIDRSCAHLRRDRFAVWVISDVRDKKSGAYRGLVADTVNAFRRAGLALYNDAIILDPTGTTALRAERPFVATRKLARVHQHLMVFVKGDARAAAKHARGDVAATDVAAS